MDAPASNETFYPARLRQLRRAIWSGALCGLCAFATTGDGETRLLRGGLVAHAVLCGLVAALRLRPLLRPRCPVLTLEPDGFSAPRLAAGLVPWTAIAYVTPIVTKHSARLILWLNAGAEASFAPSRARRIRRRLGLAGRSRMSLDLAGLDAKPWAVVRAMEAHLRRVPAEVATGETGDAPTPRRVRGPQPVVAEAGAPLFAYGLIALLAAIFALEAIFAIGPGVPVNVQTLAALGGASRSAVFGEGQWWRIVTSSLLHAGILHLAGNAYALVYAARLLERLIGWRWFAACFAASAIGGSLLSLALNPPSVVSVGASGGIVGLSAVTGVLAFRFPLGSERNQLLVGGLRILVPSILPFLLLAQAGNHHVDVAAHVGGAIGGAVLGLLLLKAWPQAVAVPPYGRVAVSIAGVFFAIALASLVPIVGGYETTREALKALAPDFPRTDAAAIDAADDLLAKYPRDPRVRYAHAWALLTKNDVAGAQRDLETALGDAEMLRPQITRMEPFLRGSLAIALAIEGHKPEAEAQLKGRCPELKPIFSAGFSQVALCR